MMRHSDIWPLMTFFASVTRHGYPQTGFSGLVILFIPLIIVPCARCFLHSLPGSNDSTHTPVLLYGLLFWLVISIYQMKQDCVALGFHFMDVLC
jgi:hypothetical protein